MRLKELILPTLLAIIFLTVLQAINPYIAAISLEELPAWSHMFVSAIQHFFAVTPWVIALGYAWAFFGWLRYNLREASIQFEAEKLYETWLWYEGLIIAMAIPLPAEAAAAVAAVLMAIKSVFKNVVGA